MNTKIINSSLFHKKPIYALRKNHIDTGVIVEKSVFMKNPHVRKYSYVGPNGFYNDARIGNYCSLSVGVQIGGMEHSYWEVSTSTRLSDDCIGGRITTIGHDVWIGADSIIKQGVSIGNGVLLGRTPLLIKTCLHLRL